MLLPFEINQAKVKELNVPEYIISWHKIRILKEIDDIRYIAMNYAQMELSLDALIDLKRLKILAMFRPQVQLIDGKYKVTSYDKIVEVFDVSVDYLKQVVEGMYEYLMENRLSFNMTDFFSGNNLKIVSNIDGTIMGFRTVEKNTLAESTENLYALLLNRYTSSYPPFIYTASFPAEAVGKTFYEMFDNKYDNKGKLINSPSNHVMNFYNPTIERWSNPLLWGPADSSQGRIYFYDPKANIPEFLRLKSIEGLIAIKSYMMTRLVPAVNYLISYQNFSTKELPPAALTEPSWYYDVVSTPPSPFYIASNKNTPYTVSLTPSTISYGQWYKFTEITKHNGKKYSFPYGTFYYKSSSGNIFYPNAYGRLKVQTGSTTPIEGKLEKSTFGILDRKLKYFYDRNLSSFNFFPYFPLAIVNGDYRIRNGILFAEASKDYELEFVFYPDSILNKLETMVDLQVAIQDIREDVKNKVYQLENPMDPANSKWFYYEFGVKNYFVHPITLQPYNLLAYLDDLIFEAGQVWATVQKEIDAFLQTRRTKNENFFQGAYQNFLRGQATALGGDALVEFERKLNTGIFYQENGFDYWRPFTTLELKVIETLKANASKNAEIATQNEKILLQNKFYLDQANAAVVSYNKNLILEADSIASSELKRMAEAELAKIVPPTAQYLIARAEVEGGVPTDILLKWTQENPYYFARPDLKARVDSLLLELTDYEQKVATALVSDIVAEIEFTKALKELFIIKE